MCLVEFDWPRSPSSLRRGSRAAAFLAHSQAAVLWRFASPQSCPLVRSSRTAARDL